MAEETHPSDHVERPVEPNNKTTDALRKEISMASNEIQTVRLQEEEKRREVDAAFTDAVAGLEQVRLAKERAIEAALKEGESAASELEAFVKNQGDSLDVDALREILKKVQP